MAGSRRFSLPDRASAFDMLQRSGGRVQQEFGGDRPNLEMRRQDGGGDAARLGELGCASGIREEGGAFP
jgi:hypothetical protein